MVARQLLLRAFGLALCIALWFVGEALRSAFDLPLPGGIIGFAVLLTAFALFRHSFELVRPGADLLLDNLILFFMPPVLSVIAYPQFFGFLGLKLILILIIGTALMMAAMGLLAQWMLRYARRTEGRDAR